MKAIKIILLSLLTILLISILHFLLFWVFMGLSNYFDASDASDEGTPIGKDYFVTYHHNGIRIVDLSYRKINPRSGGVIVINSEIVAWNFDSTFIITKQKPFWEIMDSIQNQHPNTSLDIERKLYNKIEKYNYWIIDKREDLESYYDEKTERRVHTKGLYGPFTREEYWEKRRELGVSDSLELRESEKISFDSPIHYWIHKWTYKPPARERVVD